MHRYLLFDSGCTICAQLARMVEQEAAGWLAARSLRDQEMQALLTEAKPGWRWEPTLLEVEGGRARVYTGVGMRARLGIKLGPRRAFAVARLLRQYTQPAAARSHGPSRGNFLKGAVAATSGLFLAGMGLQSGKALAARGGSASTQPQVVPLSGPEADRYIRSALASPQYARGRTKLANSYAGVLTATESAAYAVAYPALNHVGVHIPLKGGAGYSTFTAIFDSVSQQIDDTLAAFFTNDSGGDIVAHIERNERPVLDAVLTPAGAILSGSTYDASGKATPLPATTHTNAVSHNSIVANAVRHDCICCLNNCLLAQGVAQWVVIAVTAVCTAVCVGSLGLGCIICLGTITGISGNVAGYCVHQCNTGHPWGGCVC